MRRIMQLSIGSRIVKTGLAVLITSYICKWLGVSPQLAVITAIVTIEPTVSESIRKGIIRLPASTIGAALAVLSTALWGESAVTYAVVTVLTIFICMRLRLNEGVLVATLTAVAMIPTIEGNLFLIFLTRLGNTLIGLTVSTIINFVILPPKYTPLMKKGIEPNFKLASTVLEKTIFHFIDKEFEEKEKREDRYIHFRNAVQRLRDLATYQEKEWTYRKTKLSEVKNFTKFKQKIMILERVVLHLGNLQYTDQAIKFSDEEKKLLEQLAHSFKEIFLHPKHEISNQHHENMQKLDEWLVSNSEEIRKVDKHHFFNAKSIFYYELLSLHDTLCELSELQQNIEQTNSVKLEA